MLKTASISPFKQVDQRGAAIVEMTLVLPILFFLVLVVYDFGRIMSRQALAGNALREAARHAATFESGCQAEADAAMRRELSAYGMDGALVSPVTAVKDTSTILFNAPGVTNQPVPVLSVSATVQISCILCPVLRGAMVAAQGDTGLFNYVATASVPIEIPDGCS